ncbi:hypothetical protein LTR70_009548 [Exophiala xenobiotica]|uniref:RNase H type-1 domain-containing protein n=1 Tax=Lithohypha guttulata TaxID=1690604 RepID=A0ABR0JYV0_9EURO|nr:hypothetical protein LTR24_009458 [Lithohypha guttulata]KAK5310329.1 hypothetical protein LTR70_009548 [Exophiala xenobiotica]
MCLKLIRDFHQMSPQRQADFGPLNELALIKTNNEILKKLGVIFELRWVSGHKQVMGNKRADKLAGLAARSSKKSRQQKKVPKPANNKVKDSKVKKSRTLRRGKVAVLEEDNIKQSIVSCDLSTAEEDKADVDRVVDKNEMQGDSIAEQQFEPCPATGGLQMMVMATSSGCEDQPVMDVGSKQESSRGTTTSNGQQQVTGDGDAHGPGEARQVATGRHCETQPAEVIEEKPGQPVGLDLLVAHIDAELRAPGSPQDVPILG